ncbi:helix-turn-helix domain-containing protein [Streptomyces sp. NPDC090093]|uniref:helix-turn-helix domain-containing protein n=1 Tax=Streptomyces sp. NPDC090093 TaxID=3365945 RepID=UPI0037F3DA17
MVWVLSGDAPVADVNEYAVLGAMADKADPDGCGSWLSKETIAARVHVSEETVKRCWRNMRRRGLIARGDQSLVKHYRADRRPVVYDLLIPFSWFSNVDRVNAERERMGRAPLTPEDRPDLAPAPVKSERADKGKPRPKKTATQERGNSETPREEAPETPHGGTTSRPRGNYKSSTGELEDPQTSKSNQSSLSGPGSPSGDGPEADGEREAAAPEAAGADVVVDAYVTALGRPLVNGSRERLRGQAAELLAAGYSVEWLAARAAEMPAKRWRDLIQHVESQEPESVPAQRSASTTAVSRSAVEACGLCDSLGWVLDDDDDGPLVRCAHPGVTAGTGAQR